MTRPLADNLRVSIDPHGCWGKQRAPWLIVWSGTRPVLTAYVMQQGGLHAWRTNWGLYGLETQGVSEEFVADLMGWQMPQQMQGAA